MESLPLVQLVKRFLRVELKIVTWCGELRCSHHSSHVQRGVATQCGKRTQAYRQYPNSGIELSHLRNLIFPEIWLAHFDGKYHY